MEKTVVCDLVHPHKEIYVLLDGMKTPRSTTYVNMKCVVVEEIAFIRNVHCTILFT